MDAQGFRIQKSSLFLVVTVSLLPQHCLKSLKCRIPGLQQTNHSRISRRKDRVQTHALDTVTPCRWFEPENRLKWHRWADSLWENPSSSPVSATIKGEGGSLALFLCSFSLVTGLLAAMWIAGKWSLRSGRMGVSQDGTPHGYRPWQSQGKE